MSNKEIVIIGAGPGGLVSAMLLAHRGFKVKVFERLDRVGGRNSELQLGDYSFDLGPTFLMMGFILDEMFEEVGKKRSDYMEFTRLEPMYKLAFGDKELDMFSDMDKIKPQIAEHFPGNETGIDEFRRIENKRLEMVFPCLQKDYANLSAFLNPIFLKAIPWLAIDRTLITNLGRYFKDDPVKVAFSFQAKYLGMSPWECPGIFTILPIIEYRYGVFHVTGGLNRISQGLAKAAIEEGAEIHLSTPVKKLIMNGRQVKGVELENGEKVYADETVINADFGWALTKLAGPGAAKKWTEQKIRQKKFSCSTFMLYLGVDKLYDYPHHTIVFSDDYQKNVEEVARLKRLSDDPSFYIRNSSVTDPTVAPEGHSNIYVLVPTPNLKADIDWVKEGGAFRDKILDTIAEKTPLKDLKDHIVEEKVITPNNWEEDYNVFLGATFNLGHNLTQMLYLRPRNRFEEWDNCFLVGGGTHPGSGLPTIFESGRISANLISKRHGVPFREPLPLAEK